MNPEHNSRVGSDPANLSPSPAQASAADRSPAPDAHPEELGRRPPAPQARPVVELAKLIERAWLDKLPYGVAAEAADRVRQDLAHMRADLAPQGPLEQLVVEQVLAHWLSLQASHLLLASGELTGGTRQRFLLEVTNSSQRRLDSALRTLATVRRLGQVTAGEGAGRGRPDLGPDPLAGLLGMTATVRPDQGFPPPPAVEAPAER